MSDPACIRCGAPRAPGPECPRCGVIYARAEQRRAPARDTEAAGDALAPPPARPSAAALFARQESLQDARAELWLARLAVPIALLSAWLLVHTNMGGFLLRTFCSMWLHELGHAVAAWLCGFPALPGPWLTHVGEERSLVFGILITAGLGHVAWRAWTKPDRALTAAVAGVLALQLVGSLMLRATTARTLITFAGDAGGLLFGAALMATFFVPPEHKLRRDWLRWGFLVIGAAGFADVFHVWWAARSDYSMIPFGEYEHGGPTDPSKLVMEGWTIPAMINRYLGLGVLGLLVLVPLQVLHVRRTRAKLEALEAGLEQPDSSVRNSA